MAQDIEFAAIPNTQPIAYPSTLALVLGEVARSSPTPKALREFLRMRNLFDKAGFPALMAFLDVQVGGEKVTLGPVGRRLFEADEEPEVRRRLAERLVERNPLLAKYCLEAMDTEHGGRLHSTNELYRMVTSYVYPGRKPTLPSFRAWVDWAVAAGVLKLVGIRWAIGDQGREVLPRLRAMDVEEFLEEEASGATGEAEAPAPEAEAGPAVAPAPEEPAPEEPTPAVATPVGEPPAPVPQVPVEAAAPVGAEPPPAPRSRPAPTRVVGPPSPSPADRAVFRPTPPGPEDLDAARDALCAWYEGYPGRRPLAAAEAGLDPAGKAPALWHEAAFAALVRARGVPAADIRAVLSAFREAAVLPALARGRVPVDALRGLMVRDPRPEVVAACEAVVHLPRMFEPLDDLGPTLKAEDPREVLWGLWRRLYEPVAPLAPFVFARFLWEGGRLRKTAAEAAFVPWFRVRENAFRIGFCDRLYAPGFGDLVEAAVTLGARFGAPLFEGPLDQVHEGFGCAFSCPRAPVCPLPACREKGEVAPGA